MRKQVGVGAAAKSSVSSGWTLELPGISQKALRHHKYFRYEMLSMLCPIQFCTLCIVVPCSRFLFLPNSKDARAS